MTAYAKSGPVGAIIAQIGSVVFDAANCAATETTVQAITLPGTGTGDAILLTPRANLVHVGIGVGYCLVAGTARVPFINPNAAAEDPASATYDYKIMKNLVG